MLHRAHLCAEFCSGHLILSLSAASVLALQVLTSVSVSSVQYWFLLLFQVPVILGGLHFLPSPDIAGLFSCLSLSLSLWLPKLERLLSSSCPVRPGLLVPWGKACPIYCSLYSSLRCSAPHFCVCLIFTKKLHCFSGQRLNMGVHSEAWYTCRC